MQQFETKTHLVCSFTRHRDSFKKWYPEAEYYRQVVYYEDDTRNCEMLFCDKDFARVRVTFMKK